MKARSFAAVVLGLALGAAAQPPSVSLDFSGCFPTGCIRTVALVMPASIQPKRNFDRGKAALEAAGYKVKVMPRLNFKKVASVADRVADFEQAWMDPEVDLVLCARGGVGAEDLLDKLDWAKLRTRKQLSKALAEEKPMPDVKLRPLRPGACAGLACGGHISLVLKGVQMGWAADTKDRIVFLETSIREPSSVRASLDELVSRGYFKGCAGVVFGDLAAGGPNRKKLAGAKLAAARAEMAQIRKDFAAKMTCPVFEGYPYGHVPKSFAIDFLREKTITADGVLKQ